MFVSENASQVKMLNALLLLVGVATIGAGLYFAAIDRLLLTAAVCLLGLVPAGALAYALSRMEPRPTGSRLVERQRRIAFLGLALGAVSLFVGGVLAIVSPGSLATLLLWTGPGLVVGGILVLATVRHGDKSAD